MCFDFRLKNRGLGDDQGSSLCWIAIIEYVHFVVALWFRAFDTVCICQLFRQGLSATMRFGAFF